ncbi:MAG: DUF2218 domain-containing protein [Litoreibacter sp.]|nr:DUF2218 domain-containing protein [Litoreibacter sp.]
MRTCEGRFETANAAKYAQQLCKHFAHKVEASFENGVGKAALPMGPASLHAFEDRLVVRVSGRDAQALEAARYVIDAHLRRFAFREAFEHMAWEGEC